MMRNFILVFLGGGLGSTARFLLSTYIQRQTGGDFPWGTLMVNLIGCCSIGALWALSSRLPLAFPLSVFLFAGILGGFTTFSSFGLETFNLIHKGDWSAVAGYILATNILGLLCVAGGFLALSRAMGQSV